MIVSQEHKFLFFAVNKTGTTSAEKYLQNYGTVRLPKHSTAQEYKNFVDRKDGFSLDEDFASYFKFAFVRNPWDRLVSLYKYRMRPKYRDPNDRYHAFSTYGIEFEDWVLDPESSLYQIMNAGRTPAFPQSRRLSDADGAALVDFVGKFECLSAHFKQACQHIGLPVKRLSRVNVSQGKPYMDYYNEQTRAKVEEVFKEDVKRFGYTFDGHTQPEWSVVSDPVSDDPVLSEAGTAV